MADLRKCIGSSNFGIVAHEAPVEDFPAQPSQKDGLGRMCKAHWNQYTTALRKAALARKATEGGVATEVAPTVQLQAAARVATKRAARVAKPEPIRTRPARGRKMEGDPIVEADDAAVAREAANVAEASIA
jgi:hypothetical protein